MMDRWIDGWVGMVVLNRGMDFEIEIEIEIEIGYVEYFFVCMYYIFVCWIIYSLISLYKVH